MVDVINPTVITQDTTIFLDEIGVATLTVEEVDGGSTDNGEITSARLSQNSLHHRRFKPDKVGHLNPH